MPADERSNALGAFIHDEAIFGLDGMLNDRIHVAVPLPDPRYALVVFMRHMVDVRTSWTNRFA